MAHQLHYASVPAGVTGRAGFQFTARSCGAELERLVEPFMTYRPPPGAERADQCPVSLAYQHAGSGAVAVCCRYLGADYTGRPGNFLGHAVVAAPDEWDGLRPIELWRAPFWATTPARTLPTMDSLTAGTAVDPERVARMLAGSGAPGYALLAALLDATRDALAGRAGPVTLVSDDVDRTALWIGAVSYSLPIAVAHRLSFVTYTGQPAAARQHLVGTTPHTSGSGGDGLAFVVWPARAPERVAPVSPYAAAAVAAWRTGDLAEVDALCAVAAVATRAEDRPTAPDGGLDAAAALLGLCRGHRIPDRLHGPALRLLETLGEHDRARLLDRTATSLAVADPDTVAALLRGDDGARLADLLVDRDWSASPQVARLVYAGHGRRHRERRTEMTGRLVRLGPADLAPALGQLWGDAPPSAAECLTLLRHLDDATSTDEAVRDLVVRTLRAADLDDSATALLAGTVAGRYPEPQPPGADARVLLAATEVAQGCAAGAPPQHLAEHCDRLARCHPHADPGIAGRALRHAVSHLVGLSTTDRERLLAYAAPGTRTLLVGDWLEHTPDTPEARVDLAEIAVRLHRSGIAVGPLTEYLLALMRRPLAFRRVHRALAERDLRWAGDLRSLLDEAGGGWRAVFRRPVGG